MADEVSTGRVLFSGNANWSMIGRKGETQAFDGVSTATCWSFHQVCLFPVSLDLKEEKAEKRRKKNVFLLQGWRPGSPRRDGGDCWSSSGT